MPDSKKDNQRLILEQTVNTLAALNTLLTQAVECRSESSLIFHILNHTVSYTQYDRAILLKGSSRRILGVSGTSHHAKHSELADCLRQLSTELTDPGKLQILDQDSFKTVPDFWKKYTARSEGTSLLWLPFTSPGTEPADSKDAEAILILERWNNKQWRPSDIKILTPLQKGYSGVWKLQHQNSAPSFKKRGRRILCIFFLLAAIFFLQSYKIAERIVAPCEIVPEDPVAVTTAIDGVIEDIPVHPGERITAGTTLVILNQDIFREELTAARQQVKITRSELERTQAQAVNNLEARSRLLTLKNQLQMDQTRLRIADYKIEKSVITASKAGVIMMNDPHEWEGKPVITGERIMLLITPSKNKIKIYLPLADKIDFPDNAQVRIILNTDSAAARPAHLSYLSSHATVSPAGVPAFLAEAKFDHTVTDINMGIQGTAIIYGHKVSLGYWLIRRPLAALRNFTGI